MPLNAYLKSIDMPNAPASIYTTREYLFNIRYKIVFWSCPKDELRIS